jgi:hypothetical protein
MQKQLILFLLILFTLFGCVTEEKNSANLDQLNLKIDFYCYTFASEPTLDCTLNENQVKEILSEVNLIWAQANIQWELASFNTKEISAQDFSLAQNETATQIKSKLFKISPENTNQAKIWNVAIIQNFPSPVNSAGLYLPGGHTIYFAQTKKSNTSFIEVKPYVLAHELGHSLSLGHVDAEESVDNLMGPGAINAEIPNLTQEQIQIIRKQALEGPADPDQMPSYSE